MKNLFKKIMATMLCVVAAGSLFGCNIRKDVDDQEPVDPTKTQLYVGFYYSGLGKEWIQQAANRFEEMYAETSFETGKKGVQVRLDLDKAGLNGGSLLQTIAGKRDTIFFIENSDMYQFIDKGYIMDITDIVKSPAAEGETKTIEDKLTANSKNYYNVGGKYYALPYYEGMLGLNYNIDLFEEKNYYFAKGQCADDFDFVNGDLEDLFVAGADDEKSNGPDGIAGTYDDGLPATYADFRALLMYITNNGDIPMIWCGNYPTYLIEFMNAVWADAEGYDQMMLNWTMNGIATDLVDTIGSDGTVTYMTPDKDGGVSITGNKGYLLQKQEGKYEALKFAKICVGDSSYYYKDSFSGGLTHLDAQRRFVKGGTGEYENIAILIDGNWWDVEATNQFDSDPTASNSKLNRNFGFMPIPKPSADRVGEDRTLITLNNSQVFINSNTSDEMMECTVAFFKYVHSDEGMNIFSQYTNMIRPFNYTLTQNTLDNMSTYGKEMYRIHNEAGKYDAHLAADGTRETYTDYVIRIQDTYPTTSETIGHTDLLNPKTWGWTINGGSNPFILFRDNPKMTAKEYFEGLYNYYVGSWSAKWN